MAFVRRIKRNGRIYEALVENKRIDGKVVQRHIRYLGLAPEESQPKKKVNIGSLEITDSRVYGPIIVLDYLAREIGLYKILDDKPTTDSSVGFCSLHAI